MTLRFALIPLLLASASLTACAELDPAPSPQVVERIDLERVGGQSSGLGAVLGGIAGGAIGHQIGSGRGNDAAIVIGAVGGAVAGNAIEKSRSGDRSRLVVRLDDGKILMLAQMGEGELRPGDRVRVVNNRVYRA